MPRPPTLAPLLALLGLLAAPAAHAASLDLSATAELEWALATGDGRAQKLELEVVPLLRARLPEGFRLTAVGRLRADAYDRLEVGRPDQAEVAPVSRRYGLGEHAELELRELYVEGRVGPGWLRAGKQQVVWGQADGLKVLDVVNPQSFREFILEPFEDSRIPLWTLNYELPVGPTRLQLLWIPDPSTHDLPSRGDVFAFRAPRLVGLPPPPGLPVQVRSADRPDSFLEDSDAGARLAGRWRGWDLALHYLYHYDDVPTLRRRLRMTPGGPVAVVRPEYERAHVVGVTGANVFGSLTVRTELAYTVPRWFPTRDAADDDGAVRADELAAVLGLDWYGFEDTLLSLQIFPSFVANDAPGLLRDRLDTNLTLLARRTFWKEKLVAEGIWIHNLNQEDGVVRPAARYELRDDLWVWVGLDLFYGTDEGLFGQYTSADRALLGIEWSL